MEMENRIYHQTLIPKKMEFEYLKRITEQFSEKLLIDGGGFGTVYKGKKDDGGFIAVKKLMNTPGMGMDDKQFLNEVIHVMDISHPNIVRLEGYCYHVDREVMTHQGKRILVDNVCRLLCFEYLPKGNLKSYLKEKSGVLDWNKDYNIIAGICKGLHYLHEGRGGSHILHLDLKPTNVLLDKDMTPKIADFGQSRLWLLGEGQTHTANVVGTPGYMAPKYIHGGKLTKKTDIYSLGVIIMEIIAGGKKCPKDDLLQINKVRGKWKRRLETTSRNQEYQQVEKCIEVALDCMEDDADKRHDINQVIKDLGISENMKNPRPHGIEEHCVLNINSGEEDPLEERVGVLQRPSMTGNKSSPPEIMAESSMTAKKTQLPGTKKCMSVSSLAVLCAILIGVCIDLAIFDKVIAITKEPRVSITVEEASLTKFAMVTSPTPALTYNLSVTMGIYAPYMGLVITEQLRAAFFLSDQMFCVARLAETGEMLSTTTLVSRGPLSGKVRLGSADITEYKSKNWGRSSFQVELVLRGQVMYTDRYALCKVKGTCLLNLELAPQAGMTAPAFQNVKCNLNNC